MFAFGTDFVHQYITVTSNYTQNCDISRAYLSDLTDTDRPSSGTSGRYGDVTCMSGRAHLTSLLRQSWKIFAIFLTSSNLGMVWKNKETGCAYRSLCLPHRVVWGHRVIWGHRVKVQRNMHTRYGHSLFLVYNTSYETRWVCKQTNRQTDRPLTMCPWSFDPGHKI